MTGTKSYYTPLGRFTGLPEILPRATTSKNQWWLESKSVGKVTRKSRKIKIFNMLTRQEDILEVFMFLL
jgi:hypothetical protein